MRRGWSVVVLSAVIVAAGAAVSAGSADAAGRGFAAVHNGHGGAFGRHAARARDRWTHPGRARRGGHWAGWAYGWPALDWGGGLAPGYAGNPYVEELAVSRYDPSRDPAVCCGPRLPIAIGIQAAPVAPPTTYVIEGPRRLRQGSARGVRVQAQVHQVAPGLALSGSEATRPRIVELR